MYSVRLITALVMTNALLTAAALIGRVGAGYAGYFLAADDNDVLQLWAMTLDAGTHVEQLTFSENDVVDYAVHGNTIIYATPTHLNHLKNNTLTPLMRLRDYGVDVWGIDVAPNGETVVFSLDGDIWAMPMDGGAPHMIAEHRSRFVTSDPAWFYRPRYAPDGSRVLVQVALWEGTTSGWLDLDTLEVTLLPLIDVGEPLNNYPSRTGETWLSNGHILSSSNVPLQMTDPNKPRDLNSLLYNADIDLVPADNWDGDIFLKDMVEVRPQELILYTQQAVWENGVPAPRRGVFTYHVGDDVLRQVAQLGDLPDDDLLYAPQLSPDGQLIMGMIDVHSREVDTSTRRKVSLGTMVFMGATGQHAVMIDNQRAVAEFRWYIP